MNRQKREGWSKITEKGKLNFILSECVWRLVASATLLSIIWVFLMGLSYNYDYFVAEYTKPEDLGGQLVWALSVLLVGVPIIASVAGITAWDSNEKKYLGSEAIA